jgi:mannose-6-phosphate isomerase-like protein (cupin superfamily)
MATETELKQIRPIKYERPEILDQPKVTVSLVGSELLRVGIQVVQPKGGETNMHAHPALDSTWLVLSGKAKFYGFGDALIGEAGPHEGVFIPKGVPYWFEASGEEPLEILHITARDPNARNERVDYAPPAERQARRERGTGGRVATEEERAAANG